MTDRSPLLVLAALAAALLAAPAAAQQTATPAPAMASPAPTSPAKKELIAKIIALQQPAVEGFAQQLAQQPLARLLLPLNQALQARVPADKRQSVAKDIDAEARKFLEGVSPLLRERAIKLAPEVLGPILDQKFSEDELKQLAAWLDSPVNKKFQQVSGEIQQAFTQRLVADTRAEVEPKLRAFEERVGPMVGISASSPAGASAPKSAAAAKPAASGPARPASKP